MIFTGLLTVHLIGVALGVGGATIGDLAVLRSLRRGRPAPRDELRALGQVIWSGLALLGVSGAALFGMKPSAYIHNSGFVAKMIVAGVLVANGAYLHRRLPTLRVSAVTLALGAISAVSWYGALAIAMFKSKLHIPLDDYLLLYLVAVLAVWAAYSSLYRRLRASVPSEAVTQESGPDPELREELDRLRRDNETLRLAIRHSLGIDVKQQDAVLQLAPGAGQKEAPNGKRPHRIAS
jgi:hypothetical protein